MPNVAKLSVISFFRCVFATTLVVLCSTPGVSAQALAEDDRLLAAERALLEGLASKGGSAFEDRDQRQQPTQVELQPATYSGPVGDGTANNRSSNNQLEEHTITIQRELRPKVISQPKPQRIGKPSVADKVGSAPTAQHPNTALKRELEASQKRVLDLERQLEEVKGQLTMAETELSRLATVSETRNRASLGQSPVVPSARLGSQSKTAATRAERPHIEPTPSSSATLTIATVTVEKAELRLGPGKNHSALMTVAKGSRLAVEARQGEWLRVFAPNGQRAWILSKLVVFGAKTGSSNSSSAVRVRGYSSSLEDSAFRHVQSLTGER